MRVELGERGRRTLLVDVVGSVAVAKMVLLESSGLRR